MYIYNEEDFIKECRNKSAFTEQELKALFENEKYRTIIKVLFIEGFDKKVNLATLYDSGILSQSKGPRLNTILSKQNFEKLKKIGRRTNN